MKLTLLMNLHVKRSFQQWRPSKKQEGEAKKRDV